MSQDLPIHEEIVNAAMEMADNGVPVFPVSSSKTPVWKKGESPNGKDGFHMATTDAEEVEELFNHPRLAGIGMPTGKKSRCTIIDVDCGKGKKDREAAVAWLEVTRNRLKGAKVIRTKSGGYHYYCQYTPDIKSAGAVWGPGVDCRNDGGYVVIPPFMGYEVVRHMEPEDWPTPPEPLRKTGAVKVAEHSGETPPHLIELRDLLEAGTLWHDPARDIVAHLVGSGWSDAEILRQSFNWTWSGHTAQETFEELCVMINGARSKWDRETGKVKVDIEAVRAERLLNTWDSCLPETRRQFLKALGIEQ